MSVAEVEPRKKRRRTERRRTPLGPHTKQHKLLAGLDWRTREAKVIVAAREKFTRHVGGEPNAVQRALIERAARLTLYIELMDSEAIKSGTMTERNSRQYLAWVNSLRLTLRELGIEEAAPKAKRPAGAALGDYLASKAAQT